MDTQTLPPQVGEILEKGQQSASNTTKSVVSDVVNTVSDQVGIRNETNSANTQNQSQKTPEPTQNIPAEDLEATREMVTDYYSPSQVQSNAQQAELEEQQRQAQLVQVRAQLAQQMHNENYFNEIRGETYSSQILHAGESRGQVQEQVQQEEEVEEQKKMQDLQQQQKKSEDLAKFRAERAVEIKGGIVG